MSVRLSNCLKQIDGAINTDRTLNMEILTSLSEGEMLRLPNFGRKSLNELKEILKLGEQNLNYDLTNLQNKIVPDAKPYKVRKAGFEFSDDDIYCESAIIPCGIYWIDKRNIQIYIARNSGITWKAISIKYDVGACRAAQIYEKLDRTLNFGSNISHVDELRSIIYNWTDLEYHDSELSVKTWRTLAMAGFVHKERGLNVTALSELTMAQFRMIRDCGPKTIYEVQEFLKSYGMDFNHGVKNQNDGVWPRDRDIYIYRMREAGYKFTEVGDVFGVTGSRASTIHLEVKQLMEESPIFNKFVSKNDINKEENL